MLGKLRHGRRYRVGAGGVRLTWPDGHTTSLPAHAVVSFAEHLPQRVEGRLYRTSRTRTGYEAPTLDILEHKD